MIQTPIQKLEFPNDRNVRLYCKREDLLPFSLGGNKVRIGRAFFQDMQEKNKDCMIIYGNSRSNLCRVLANLCCAEKIPCYMICSSEENEEHPIETNNSRLMKWLGAEVIPCRKTEIAQTVEQTMNRLTEEGYHPYYIFGDKFGTGNEGTPVQAYVDGYREILAWEKEQNISFSHIFAASGTGSTQCGISDYFAKNHLVLPEGWESELHLEMGYRQGGYGQYDERILQVIREEFCRNGLPLDPTYTGKAFWGMKQYIEEHQLQDCDVLFIHTGGTPLFYDCILNDTDGGKK